MFQSGLDAVAGMCHVSAWMVLPECVMFQPGLDAVAECVVFQPGYTAECVMFQPGCCSCVCHVSAWMQ